MPGPGSPQQPFPAPPPAVFGSVTEALAALQGSLAYLASAGADAADLPAETVAGCLRVLSRAESMQVAARSRLLSAFTAQDGAAADGHPTTRSWLRWQTRVTGPAAGAETAWMKRLAAHRHVAAALAGGGISVSWALQVCEWTDQLVPELRDDADLVLLAALDGGADLADAAGLFREILERTAPPDTDGPAFPGSGDDENFYNRRLSLDLHYKGAGLLAADLTPECAAALLAMLESLGKKAGPEDTRTVPQRYHDALEEACRRLLGTGGLPDVAGQPAMVQLHVTLDQLRDLVGDGPGMGDGHATGGNAQTKDGTTNSRAGSRPGERAATGAFLAGRAAGDGIPGWLSSPAAAEAYCCDARISPVITGHLDPAVVAAAIRAFLDPDGT